MAINLALQSPDTAVGVEDSVAEEFIENGGVAGAFNVVGKVGNK